MIVVGDAKGLLVNGNGKSIEHYANPKPDPRARHGYRALHGRGKPEPGDLRSWWKFQLDLELLRNVRSERQPAILAELDLVHVAMERVGEGQVFPGAG